MASEIVVALIGGGAGLATGVVGSLFAPWASWGIEKQRRKQDRRVERIKEWRSGVAELRQAEPKDGKRVGYRNPEAPNEIVVGGVQPPSVADVHMQPWFRTLKHELSASDLTRINELADRPVAQRVGEIPDLLDDQISRLERKWELI